MCFKNSTESLLCILIMLIILHISKEMLFRLLKFISRKHIDVGSQEKMAK